MRLTQTNETKLNSYTEQRQVKVFFDSRLEATVIVVLENESLTVAGIENEVSNLTLENVDIARTHNTVVIYQD